MAARRKQTPVRGITIFIVAVVISGYALSATGHFDNPFTEISDSVSMNSLLDGQFAPSGGDAMDLSSDSVDTTAKPSFDDLTAQDANANMTDTGALDLSNLDDSSDGVTLAADDSFAGRPFDGDRLDRGEGQGTIQWSQIGDVLFDLWFICAATAVVIVLQQLVSFAIRSFKRRARPAMAA